MLFIVVYMVDFKCNLEFILNKRAVYLQLEIIRPGRYMKIKSWHSKIITVAYMTSKINKTACLSIQNHSQLY